MALLYLDSSALCKLIVPEAETAALQRMLEDWPERAASSLARVEIARMLLRQPASGEATRQRARALLENIALLGMDEDTLFRAAALRPQELRTLDAIHLATALSLPGLAGMVVYDRRLAAAARSNGVEVWAPGQEL